MFQLLSVSHSSGSWTRNLLPDGWKNGSGGNSQYYGPGTAGDTVFVPSCFFKLMQDVQFPQLFDPATPNIPLARIANPNAPGGHGGYMQTNDEYATNYNRGPAGIHAGGPLCPNLGGIC